MVKINNRLHIRRKGVGKLKVRRNPKKRVSYSSEGILIGELSGARLKKDLGLRRVAKRWHNRNKSGGNFGINLYTLTGNPNYEITGEHNMSDIITSLRVSELYGGSGVKIMNRNLTDYHTWTYPRLINLLKKVVESQTKDWVFGVNELA